MANTISLSSDMTQLIFIHSTGKKEIDLSGNGAVLEIISGDIYADDASTAPIGGVSESTIDAQWTVTFNDFVSYVFLIGIDNVDVSKIEKKHDFALTGKKLYLRRSGSDLQAVLV